jgi:hypothetical protein
MPKAYSAPQEIIPQRLQLSWAERIRTSKRQFDEVLGTSAEFSCSAEAI